PPQDIPPSGVRRPLLCASPTWPRICPPLQRLRSAGGFATAAIYSSVMPPRRAPVSEPIWITGIGAATPLGPTYAEIADNLLRGKSGIRRVTRFPVKDHPSQIAGLVNDVPRPEGVSAAEFAALRPLDQLGLWCGIGALRDAGWYERRAQTRIGLVLGPATEWVSEWGTDGVAA